MKLLLFSLLILLLSGAGARVSGQPDASALSLVPSRSVAVLSIDWKGIRRDEFLNRLARGEEMASILSRLGISESGVRSVSIFSDLSPAASGKMGMIASGNFTASAVMKKLDSLEWKIATINGKRAYIDPGDGSFVVVPRNGTLIAGTKSALEQTLAVIKDPRVALVRKNGFSSIMSGFGKSAPLRFFMGIPEEYGKAADFVYKIATKMMSFAGMGILGAVLDKIGLIQSMGFAMGSSLGNNVPVHLMTALPSKTKAQMASGGLNLLKRAASMIGSKDAESGAVKSMTVENRANLLSIKFSMPKSSLPLRN